jgi:outer membrane protein TolC
MVGVPEDLAEHLDQLTLVDAIDIALRNSPVTRRTWAAARSAAAEVGQAKADYFPEIDVSGDVSHVKQSAVGGQFSFEQTVYGPSAELSWMLLDFGGRRAGIEKTRRALEVADWAHNQAIQDVVLSVELAYYSFLSAKAQLEATAATVKEAETNLEAATVRHDAGVATIADVLQAKTVLSEAQLSRLVAEGQIGVITGTLATTLGVPANTALDIGETPKKAPVDEFDETVEKFIERALTSRPDLLAERARFLEAQSEIASAKAERWPTLNAAAGADRTYYDGDSISPYSDNWAAAITLDWNVFDGFRRKYAIRQAEEDAAAARARVETTRQRVILEVWRSYQDVRTAGRRVTTSADLLASAEQNGTVALGRYREGVGSILDLLTAQALLASARAQVISASTDWYLAVARLAHATGTIALRPAGGPGTGGGGR